MKSNLFFRPYISKLQPGVIISILLCLILSSCGSNTTTIQTDIQSPDNLIQMLVTTSGGESESELMYNIQFQDKLLIKNARLGIELKGVGIVSNNFEIVKTLTSSHDETYTQKFGKNSVIRDHYNETILSLKNSDNIFIDLIIRAFNDGIAFRYHFPVQVTITTFEITNELTSFNFTENHHYWGQHPESYQNSYENTYTAADIANIAADSLTALPLLLEAEGIAWTAITEANLTNYAGMYVKGSLDEKYELCASLSPLPDNPDVCVKAETPFSTPWRVIMIADEPGKLIESDIVLNLNDECAFDSSWVKPGKTAWDWWCCKKVVGEDFEGAMDDRTMKYFIDFAAEYGLEYMLVDAGWYGSLQGSHNDYEFLSQPQFNLTQSIPEIDIPELVRYANSKGVDIIVWLHWIHAIQQMDEAFPLYEKWGVKGVKIDFMNRDDQEMVNYYRDMVRKSAEHKLLIDFHGAYKPTGIRRTYPNLITREGVRGLEWLKVSDSVNPEYNCTVPFTRMLAGPMDYTPGGFNNVTREQHSIHPDGWSATVAPMTLGTRCHQMALFVIFESPLQMVADYPDIYRKSPESTFMSHVPTVWDETRVLQAKVSDYLSIARKKGEEWYLGSITDWTARELTQALDFLGDGDYIAEIYADGAEAATNAKDVSAGKYIVNNKQSMTIKLASGGGHAVRFYPSDGKNDLPHYENK